MCNEGYIGGNCDIKVSNCKNCVFGTCDEKTSVCMCYPDYQGQFCDIAIPKGNQLNAKILIHELSVSIRLHSITVL